jgi:hypothetical protein
MDLHYRIGAPVQRELLQLPLHLLVYFREACASCGKREVQVQVYR